tara:strand:+ start:848 stop:1240 length:393 start_codon:yes stop_codon:yes gene_type:complete
VPNDAPDTSSQITWGYTYDLDAAEAFYRDVLGLKVVLQRGGCQIYKVNEGAYLGICAAREGRTVEPEGSLITFVTDEVDAWYTRLQAAGVATDGPPHALPEYGIYAFFATRPDGYKFEFQRFDSPDWADA